MQSSWSTLDLNLFRSIHVGWHHPLLDLVFFALATSGIGQVPALVSIVLWVRQYRELAVRIVLAALFVGLIGTHLGKRLVPRQRPSNLVFARPQEPHREGSFPSGHTTLSFAVATTLALYSMKRRKPAYAILAYAWSSSVGLSRIYRGVHWPSDVAAGACLGIAGGLVLELALGAFLQKKFPEPESTKPS